MEQIRIFLVLVLLLLALPARGEEVRIRNIYVDTLDVFDTDEFDAWYYQWANRLHITTRPSFIRQELLFREGDALDEDLLKECERNLRRYGFLTSASVESVPVSRDEVDVYVRTEDQWTLNLSLSYGQSRGSRTYDLGFQENNFLGLGKKVGFKTERNEERETITANYFDPRLMGSRLQLTVDLAEATDGHHHSADFALPFFSESSRWSFDVAVDDLRKNELLYYAGTKAAYQLFENTSSSLAFQHAWGTRYHRTLAGIYTGYREDVYPSAPVILNPAYASQEIVARNFNPPDRRFLEYGLTAGIDFQNFTTRTYLDYYGATEDLPYGPAFNVSLLRTQNKEGSDYVHLVAGGNVAMAPGNSGYGIVSADAGIRRQDGDWNNLYFRFSARGYLQTGPANLLFFRSPRQTLAGSLSGTFTNKLDLPFQLSLGEDEGLRGYRFKSFLGTNKLLLNLEDRIFTNFENKLIGLAVVPFVDAGAVWDNRMRRDGGVSAGIGLRIGIKKFRHSHTIRLDFAWPLIRGVDRGISVSFASGQVFSAL